MKNLLIFTILMLMSTLPLQAQQDQNHVHTEHLETLLSDYLDMKEALVNDNLEDAKSSFEKFAEKVTSSSEMNDHHEHADKHKSHHVAMLSAVETASSAENIDQLRNSFDEISAELIKAIKNQDFDADLHIQFCPMADNGNGARWLSKKEKIENPYYGSKMLSCGSLEEQI